MEYIILGLAALVILFCLSLFTTINKNKKNHSKSAPKKKTGIPTNVTCPMCSNILFQGENLVSRVYRPMNVPDQRCTIAGCPHCYPAPEPGVKRICPVCKKEVPLNGYLIARLFNHTMKKKHVMISGCSRCLDKK
ncbi:MAG: hypothetical protein MJ169_07210 [Treponema sp.]|nr:hypothetical protein [Treponema sp.]